MNELLNDYQQFKSQLPFAWLADFTPCQIESSVTVQMNQQEVWQTIEKLKPQQGWFTLASEIVLFETPTKLAEILKDQPYLINGEMVSADSQTSWHIHRNSAGDINLVTLQQTQGQSHLVKQQIIKLKSPTKVTGEACYAVYYQTNVQQDYDHLTQVVASRFLGFKG